jgi:hypothetical protein
VDGKSHQKKAPRREGRTLVTLGERWRILFIINFIVLKAILFIFGKFFIFLMTFISPAPVEVRSHGTENWRRACFPLN